jgi:hypothetical protein
MLAGLVSAAALAQTAAKDPREDLWKQKWIPAAVKKLKAVHLWPRYDVLVGYLPPSNYEIAIGAIESYQQLKQSITEAMTVIQSLEKQLAAQEPLNDADLRLPDPVAKLYSLINSFDLLDKMATCFAPEIGELGASPSALRRDLLALRIDLISTYSRGVLAAARSFSLPDVPKYAYVKSTLHGLKGDGLASNYGGLFAGSNARDYKAQELIACCDDFTKFSGMAKSLIANLKSQLQTKPLPSEMDQIKQDLIDADSIVDLLAKWSSRRRDINRTIDFFSAEISALGRDPKELKKQLKEAL